jgi:murein DD-endopeptidase MepM/ murein hydrolase activator NlpD
MHTSKTLLLAVGALLSFPALAMTGRDTVAGYQHGPLDRAPVAEALIAAESPEAKPFGLPFDSPPSAAGWLLGQPYGNTTGAYRFGDVWYGAGQGLHFGLDFITPCGTPVVSIGDGEVVESDWLARGSGPHNLVVSYPAEGFTALYGHLLERPALNGGDAVVRGQVVGLSGDPDETCSSRPHLHLELRSTDYRTAYNPVDLIQADWDALLLIGPFSDIGFARDVSEPLRWVKPDDQPDVMFGGPRLNGYSDAWPSNSADGNCVVDSC